MTTTMRGDYPSCDIFMSLSTFLRFVRLTCIFVRQEDSTALDNFVIPMAA